MKTTAKTVKIASIEKSDTHYKLECYSQELIGGQKIKIPYEVFISLDKICPTMRPTVGSSIELILDADGHLVACNYKKISLFKLSEEEYKERYTSFNLTIDEQLKQKEILLEQKYGLLSSIFRWRRKMMKEYAPNWKETKVEVLWYYLAQSIYFLAEGDLMKIQNISLLSKNHLEHCLPIMADINCSDEVMSFAFEMAINLYHEKTVGSSLNTLSKSPLMLQSNVKVFGKKGFNPTPKNIEDLLKLIDIIDKC